MVFKTIGYIADRTELHTARGQHLRLVLPFTNWMHPQKKPPTIDGNLLINGTRLSQVVGVQELQGVQKFRQYFFPL